MAGVFSGIARLFSGGKRGSLGSRKYDAASRNGRFSTWTPTNGSADAEISTALPVLRARSRDLVRNNPSAAKAVQVLVDNLVGPGIRPRSRTGNKDRDRLVNDLWARWAAACDADGHTDFHGLTSLAVRQMIEGGDVFALRETLNGRDRRRLSSPVPFVIGIREAEHLDESRDNYPPKEGRIECGIEFDATGRRRAYWMFKEHPGGNNARIVKSDRVSADRVAHLFERQRVQSRGVPWAAPVMRALREMDEWHEAEIVRKKTEACMAAMVLGDDEGSTLAAVKDSSGNYIETFRPGMIAYLSGAKDVKFNQPAQTGGVYEWHSVHMHMIAAGFRVPYELMTGDLKQVNFSSSRVGLNSFRRMVEAIQWQTIIPMFCQKVWDWFIEVAITAGHLPDGTYPVEWAPPKFESVNPFQDAQADLLEVRAGFSSLQQVIGRRGYDFDAVMAEIAEAAAEADRLSLTLDSDPRKVAKSGAAQVATDPGQSSE